MHVISFLHAHFCALAVSQTLISVLSTDSLIKYSHVLISNVTENFSYTLLPSKTSSGKDNMTFVKENYIYFTIRNKSKVMRVMVYSDELIYSEDTIVEIHNVKTSKHYLNNVGSKNNYLYSGYVIGNNGSSVSGFFRDGIFNGIVHLKNQDYFVETGILLTPKKSNSNAVMYSRSDIVLSDCTKTKNCTFGQCALSQALTMSSMSGYNIAASISANESANRSSSQSKGRTDGRKTCSIELVADHTFFQAYNSNHRAIISTLLLHVKNADSIFRQVDFDNNNLPDNLGFVVKKITIFENPDFSGYPFTGHFDHAKDYIMAFTYYRHNTCLSLAFTNRQFSHNQVGIAFVPSPNPRGDYGGLCEETKLMHDGSVRNLNIAIVSTLVGGRRLPSALTSSTVVHELGHSFGSLHDPDNDSECSPKGSRGSYIMSPYTNDGGLPNNKLFSKCSVEMMRKVVEVKGKCLEAKGLYCGDGIKEGNEECDCGEPSVCHMVDPCCTPKDGVGSDRGCSFRRQLGYECSAKTDQCCTDNCKIVPASKHHACKSAYGTCIFTSVCNGTSSECPVPEQTNKSACSSIVCDDRGLETCHCPSTNVWECFVCCKSDGKCVPAIQLVNMEIGGLRLPVGTKCHEGEGECDSFSRCIVVSGRDIGQDPTSFTSWLNANWQYILATAAAVCLTVIAGMYCYSFILDTYRDTRRPLPI